MRRPRAKPVDSLELLLDTICNTFGGVLFIAILVSLLLQLSGSEETTTPEETVSAQEFEELAERLEALNAELASLRDVSESQGQLVAQFAPEATRALIAQKNTLEAANNELREQIEQQRIENAKTHARIEQGRSEIAAAEQALEMEKQKAAELAEQIEQSRQARTEELRMPVVHSAGLRRSVGLIVRFGRMYVWHRYDQFGNREGLNTDEFVVIEDSLGRVTTMPNPTAGIPLDSDTAEAAILSRLSQFSPRSTYVEIVLRPDSFGHFRTLRNALIRRGFEYRLLLVEEGAPVADRGGTGSNVQ